MAKLSKQIRNELESKKILYSYVRNELGQIKGVILTDKNGKVGWSMVHKVDHKPTIVDLRQCKYRFMSPEFQALYDAFDGSDYVHMMKIHTKAPVFDYNYGFGKALSRLDDTLETIVSEIPIDSDLYDSWISLNQRADRYYK
jgi:hypothetical protein